MIIYFSVVIVFVNVLQPDMLFIYGVFDFVRMTPEYIYGKRHC